jgi:3-deoxy-D-manno-octulosonic acid kinase
MILRLPQGYQRLASVTPLAVAHDRVADAIRGILATSTLYEWARQHPERWEYRGRAPVYGAPLPGGPRVVVRHAWRGGLLAGLLRDLYVPPTPAPSELLTSAILQQLGVPTPPVLAFATYRAAGILRRADIVTVEVDGRDLAAALAAADPAGRRALVAPVATLIGNLTEAGAWHQDLNAKNILITARADATPLAVVLDVDRVRFTPGGDPHVRGANLDRLRRSIDKSRSRGLGTFSTDDWAALVARVNEDDAIRESVRHARTVDLIA